MPPKFTTPPEFVIDTQADGFGFVNLEKFKAKTRGRRQRRGSRIPEGLAGAH